MSKEVKLEQIAELEIYEQEDRMKISALLVKNGYTVGTHKRPKTKTGKTIVYALRVYREKQEETMDE